MKLTLGTPFLLLPVFCSAPDPHTRHGKIFFLACARLVVERAKTNGASPLAKIAVGLVRLDYSAEVVQHAHLSSARARERAVLRVRDRVTNRVWPRIPDRAVSKPIAD